MLLEKSSANYLSRGGHLCSSDPITNRLRKSEVVSVLYKNLHFLLKWLIPSLRSRKVYIQITQANHTLIPMHPTHHHSPSYINACPLNIPSLTSLTTSFRSPFSTSTIPRPLLPILPVRPSRWMKSIVECGTSYKMT